jgi:Fuc2NAc and GlcNAc transferase
MLVVTLFLLSFVLTYAVKVYATKKALVDIPNERSSHSVAVPHGGGIAIAVTWFIGISYLYYFQKEVDSLLYMALMMGVILSAVSYLDDLYHLSVKLRLVVQICVTGFGLYLLGGLHEINLFFLSVDNWNVPTFIDRNLTS